MTPEEFKQAMLALAGPWDAQEKSYNPDDVERSHALMDELMVKVLRELGYGEGCDVFDKTPAWYA